jgi:hypothetical protein
MRPSASYATVILATANANINKAYPPLSPSGDVAERFGGGQGN